MQMFRMQRSVNSVGGPSFHEKVGQRCKTDRACQSDRAVSLNNPCPRQTTLNSPHHHSHSPVCSPLVSPSGSFLDSLAVSCCPLFYTQGRLRHLLQTNTHSQKQTPPIENNKATGLQSLNRTAAELQSDLELRFCAAIYTAPKKRSH